MWIIIKDAGGLATVPIGHNGVFTEVPVGEPFFATDDIIDALNNSSVAFEPTTEGGRLEEGVLDGLPPEPTRSSGRPSGRFSKFDHDYDGFDGGSLPKNRRPKK